MIALGVELLSAFPQISLHGKGTNVVLPRRHLPGLGSRAEGCRAHHTDTPYRGEAAPGRFVAHHLGELVVQRLDPLVEHELLVEHVPE
jgi:hypothetical protein